MHISRFIDICERIRLPYGSEIQTTDFLSALQDFINGNGIYLCGDKHTSSIAASYIHDIPHYFCGHPFVFEKNEFPSGCIYKDAKQDSEQDSEQKKNSEIDYNLIEIRDGKTGQVRKIHLIKGEDGLWKCQIHPIDAVVSGLYETSRKYIVKNSLFYWLLKVRQGTIHGQIYHGEICLIGWIQELMIKISRKYQIFTVYSVA